MRLEIATNTDYAITVLLQENGKSPVEEWIQGIRDKPTRLRVLRQIDKLRRGIGNQKNLGGVYELKIDLGPGYRVYYAYLNQKTLVVLIYGGDKSTQSKDIAMATQLWKAFEDSGYSETALRKWAREQDSTASTQALEDTGVSEEEEKS